MICRSAKETAEEAEALSAAERIKKNFPEEWVKEIEDLAYKHFGTSRQEVEAKEDWLYQRDVEVAAEKAEKGLSSKATIQEVEAKAGKVVYAGSLRLQEAKSSNSGEAEGLTSSGSGIERRFAAGIRSEEAEAGRGEEETKAEEDRSEPSIQLKSAAQVFNEDLDQIEQLTEDNLRELEDEQTIELTVRLGQLSVEFDQALSIEKAQRRAAKCAIQELDACVRIREEVAERFGRTKKKLREIEHGMENRRKEWESIKAQRPRIE